MTFRRRGAGVEQDKAYFQVVLSQVARGSRQFEYVTEDDAATVEGASYISTATADGQLTIDEVAVGDIIWYWQVTTADDDQTIEDDKASGVLDNRIYRVTDNDGTALTLEETNFGAAGALATTGTPVSGDLAEFTNASTVRGRTPTELDLLTATALASVANGAGASLIGVEDAAGRTDAVTVEDAIADSFLMDEMVEGTDTKILTAAERTLIASALQDADIGVSVQAYDADLTTYAGITPSANVQSLLGSADYAAMKVLLDLEIGTDVLAQQTIGIADDNLLEVDGDPNSGEVAVYTANGLAGQTEAEFKTAFNLVDASDIPTVDATGAPDNSVVVDGAPIQSVLLDLEALVNVLVSGVLDPTAVTGAVHEPSAQTWDYYSNASGALVILGSNFADGGEGLLKWVSGAGDIVLVPATDTFTINGSSGLQSTVTVTDGVFQNSSGANTELQSTSALIPLLTAGQYLLIASANTAGNVGWYVATGTPTTSLLPLTKLANGDGSTLTNPADDTSSSTDVNEPAVDASGANLLLNSKAAIKRVGNDFDVGGGTNADKSMDGSNLTDIADVTMGGDLDVTGDVTVSGEIYSQLSPWQTMTGSQSSAPSGRAWKITGNATAVPVTDGWWAKVLNISGSSKTIAGASGSIITTSDATTGTTLTIGDDKMCFLHSDGTNIYADGDVTVA